MNVHFLPRQVLSIGVRQARPEINASGAGGDTFSPREKIDLLKWHLDRYDRLRASTASRASVVLSATAILSAGNALLFSQLLIGSHGTAMPRWLVVAFTVAVLGSAVMIVLSLIRASRVLVTSRDSRRVFASGEDIPDGLLFNGTDTVRRIEHFKDFQGAIQSQGYHEILTAAQVELWIVIQQHRHRYAELRRAVRQLRWSAVMFLAVLTGTMLANLAGHV